MNTDRDTRREQIARIIVANVGFDSLVDGAAAYAIADAAASAVLAAGLVVPSGLTAEKLLRDVLAEMDAAAKWAFPCLQPHSESIVAAREWADALSTQETL